MIGWIEPYLAGLTPLETTAVVLGAALVGAVAVEVVGMGLLRRAVARTDSRFDDVVLGELRLPVVLSVFLAGVWALTRLESVGTVVASEELALLFGNPALSLIAVAWAWGLNRMVNRAVATMQETGRQYALAPVLSNVWTIALVLGAGVALLSIWRIDVTPLLGAAGIAGIAIGFAAKDTVANFFGGLALYVDDTYKLGDYVVLDSGEAGTVVHVGVRSTTLLTRSEVLVTVPNAMLNAGKVVNESAPKRRKRITVPLAVAYGTDVDELEALVDGVAAAEDLVLERPRPRVRFRRFGDSGLEYELLCWVASPDREGKATHRLNRALYAALADAGIEVPYPTRDLRVRDAGTGADPAVPSADHGPDDPAEVPPGDPDVAGAGG